MNWSAIIMGDIKLFNLSDNKVEELSGQSLAIEKSLQDLMESNLDSFLGIRFLASEYTTGKRHAGRIDTLGIDENGFPVIIEYKRATNENVINQGLYYLEWLFDHKAEFELLVQRRYGIEEAEAIDWSSPRLLCIAGGFTKYDVHAVQQINRHIELYQYKHYEAGLLLLDLVNNPTPHSDKTDSQLQSRQKGAPATGQRTIEVRMQEASTDIQNLFAKIKDYALALGDDVQTKTLKDYIAFKRIKNFLCLEVHPTAKKISVYVKADLETIDLEDGFTRDVTNIGHFGTGNLELTLYQNSDFEKAKAYIEASYDGN